MGKETYKPMGFCPHCGYALDPGVCTECGQTASASELDVVMGQKRRRYRARNVAKWAALLFIVVGGYHHCPDINFKSMVPTSCLLMLDRYEIDWASWELWSGFRCGTLSDSDAASFFEQHVAISPLQVTSPHPANESICLRMS